MGAIAQLSTATLDVEPGRGAAMAITVRNTGSVVDRFTFEAVGAAAAWVTFAPDTLSLFPEASGTVNVMFSPPRLSSVTAGPTPFGIRVASSEDPAGSVVEEGTLNVTPFSDVGVELVPRITRGRRTARAQLAVDNRSNCAYQAEIEGTDPSAALAIAFSPAVIDIPPGGASFVKLRIKPKQTFWRGPTTMKPFRLTINNRPSAVAAPEGGTPGAPAPNPHPPQLFADGSMSQEAILPKWLIAAIVALIALAAILVLLWFTVLKPQIRSTAKDEVNKQLAAQGLTSAGGGSQPGGGSSGGGGGTTATTTGGSTSTGGPSTASAAGVTVNGTSGSHGNGTVVVYTVPNGRTLEVTDLLVENPNGNTGTLEIARDGTVLMQWAMANFRDLDYHWIVPTIFGPGTKMQLIVGGCSAGCSPGIYYAGNLVRG